MAKMNQDCMSINQYQKVINYDNKIIIKAGSHRKFLKITLTLCCSDYA